MPHRAPDPQDPQELGPLSLEAFLPYQLAVAADAVSKGLAAVYAERFDLSVAEWRVLANLGRHGNLTAGEVAARSSLDKVQVTRAVQRLQRRDLISRTQGRADRRQAVLALTSAGSTMVREIAGLALAWERDLVAVLSTEDRAALDRALAVLTLKAQSEKDMRQV